MAAQLSVWPAHRLRLTGSLSSVVHGSLCPLVSSSLLMYIATELLCFPALICLGLLTSVAVFNHVVSLSAPSVYLYAFLNHAFISQCKWWAPAKDFLTCVFCEWFLHFICTRLTFLMLWFSKSLVSKRSSLHMLSVFILKCFYCHFCSVCVCMLVDLLVTLKCFCVSLSLVSSVSVSVPVLAPSRFIPVPAVCLHDACRVWKRSSPLSFWARRASRGWRPPAVPLPLQQRPVESLRLLLLCVLCLLFKQTQFMFRSGRSIQSSRYKWRLVKFCLLINSKNGIS